MDDIVKQALAKWPNVPDCYGWLGLDARGLWYMRDDRAQAAGAFASGLRGAKGQNSGLRLTHRGRCGADWSTGGVDRTQHNGAKLLPTVGQEPYSSGGLHHTAL